jgi:hypothetical protein
MASVHGPYRSITQHTTQVRPPKSPNSRECSRSCMLHENVHGGRFTRNFKSETRCQKSVTAVLICPSNIAATLLAGAQIPNLKDQHMWPTKYKGYCVLSMLQLRNYNHKSISWAGQRTSNFTLGWGGGQQHFNLHATLVSNVHALTYFIIIRPKIQRKGAKKLETS